MKWSDFPTLLCMTPILVKIGVDSRLDSDCIVGIAHPWLYNGYEKGAKFLIAQILFLIIIIIITGLILNSSWKTTSYIVYIWNVINIDSY